MKVVIIGNNVAGTFTAQNIRFLDKKVEIEIYTDEKYPYYSRIKLPELISNKVKIDNLIVFKNNWYEKNNLKYSLDKKISRIDPEQKLIFLENQKTLISYDKLILATGSMPNIPPIKNARELLKKGVFTLRNIDDAIEIRNYIENNDVKKSIIIGGGLLGLELAKQVRDCKLDTTIIEFFPRLLPRQLDKECSNMLKSEIEKLGVKVVLNASTEEILGNGVVKGIKLKDGRKFDAEIILIQAGIKPTINLAKRANLETNRGIIVNEFLETSESDIFAVGDCVEYKNQTWGIIPACMEQSKIVAASVLGKKEIEYKGTTPKTTLKIVGLELTSIGIFDPSEEKSGGWEILRKADKENCCYQKIVLKDNKLKGAILFGDNKALSFVYNNMEENVNKNELRKLLELYIWVCSNCGAEYDEALMENLFEKLPTDWKCPNCKALKKKFKKK